MMFRIDVIFEPTLRVREACGKLGRYETCTVTERYAVLMGRQKRESSWLSWKRRRKFGLALSWWQRLERVDEQKG